MNYQQRYGSLYLVGIAIDGGKYSFVHFFNLTFISRTKTYMKKDTESYEKLYCVTFKRDILEASREFIVCLF